MPLSQHTIGWWSQSTLQSAQPYRIYEVTNSGQLIGGTATLHGGGLHNQPGGKILLDNAWVDPDRLLNQGVIRIKEECFLDCREFINQRVQHTWDERHTKTIKKKKYGA